MREGWCGLVRRGAVWKENERVTNHVEYYSVDQMHLFLKSIQKDQDLHFHVDLGYCWPLSFHHRYGLDHVGIWLFRPGIQGHQAKFPTWHSYSFLDTVASCIRIIWNHRLWYDRPNTLRHVLCCHHGCLSSHDEHCYCHYVWHICLGLIHSGRVR